MCTADTGAATQPTATDAPSVAPATLVATSLAPSLASSVPVAAAEPEPSSGSAVSTFVSTAAAVVAAARHVGCLLGSSAATTAVAVCLWGENTPDGWIDRLRHTSILEGRRYL